MRHPSLIRLTVVFSIFAITAHAQNISQVLNKRLDALKSKNEKERVYIFTDRDLYTPGEKIWITAVVYDVHMPVISKLSQSMYIRLYDSNDMEVLGRNFSVVNGIASGSIPLPAEFSEDIYYLRGETPLSGGPGEYFKKVIIKQKPIQPFIIQAEVADKMHLPGENIAVSIACMDFYNEPLSNVSYEVEVFDGTRKINTLSGKIKKEPGITVNIEAPKSLESGLLQYKVAAHHKGKTATLTGKLEMLTDKVFVAFYPDGGNLIDNLSTTLRYYIYDASGEPLQATGRLTGPGLETVSISSDVRGMGSCVLTPHLKTSYTLQLDLPGIGSLDFSLPEVKATGMLLQLESVSGISIAGKIKGNSPTATNTILVGESGGTIFHLSEQKVAGEWPLSIDVSTALNGAIHFILLNGEAEILAEQIIFTGEHSVPAKAEPLHGKKVLRGKMAYELDNPSLYTVMSAVNQPWIFDNLFEHQPWLIAFPYDMVMQPVYQSERFLGVIPDDQLLKEYGSYYTPLLFGWDKVLQTEGTLKAPSIPKLVRENKRLLDKLRISGLVIKKDNALVHTNLNASAYFAQSNPKYISTLFLQKVETVPSYKKLLESGTPLLDVIQTLRPFKLDGNNIVFAGSNNSLLFQGGALIAIDGVNRGTDASILRNINPYDVDRISVSTNPNDIQRYTGLNSVGVIEIWLKKGDLDSMKETAIDDDNTFEPVNHDNTKNPDPDYRSTLHWYSGAATGIWRQEFFNSDLLSSVVVRFYRIPDSGIPMIIQDSYKVESR